MVPPEDIFGAIDLRIGVFLALAASLALAGYVFHRRVVGPVLLGRSEHRFDRPLRRLAGFAVIVLGQRKVLQRLSLKDMAGLGHLLIFVGFLSFLLSYVIFIFGDSAWRPFSEMLLTETGVTVYASYLDVVALAILAALLWALARRWLARPHRLSFDLTRGYDAVVIVGLISSLMVLTLLTEAFHTAETHLAALESPAAGAIVGRAIGEAFLNAGMGLDAANLGHGLAWWLHLLVILGFSVYIPLSKHMHMVAAPANALFRSLEPRGTLQPIDLETAEHFGAGKPREFTWKELLDGYACAVCGRCTSSCPAHLTGKSLSPMHIVEDLKEYLVEEAANIKAGAEAGAPLIGFGRITEEALWDCLSCGACMEECPVVVEHVPTIIDMRRHLVLEQSKIPTPPWMPSSAWSSGDIPGGGPSSHAPTGHRAWRSRLWPTTPMPRSCCGWAAPRPWSSAARPSHAPWSRCSGPQGWTSPSLARRSAAPGTPPAGWATSTCTR